jgi:hypothetical protein
LRPQELSCLAFESPSDHNPALKLVRLPRALVGAQPDILDQHVGPKSDEAVVVGSPRAATASE